MDSNAPCGSSSSDFTRFTSTVTSQSMINGLGSSSNSSSGLERRRKNRGSSNERYELQFHVCFYLFIIQFLRIFLVENLLIYFKGLQRQRLSITSLLLRYVIPMLRIVVVVQEDANATLPARHHLSYLTKCLNLFYSNQM